MISAAVVGLVSQGNKVGDIEVRQGTGIFIPIALLHFDPQYWGPDANAFNPERFKGDCC